jgi:hypothetical protein
MRHCLRIDPRRGRRTGSQKKTKRKIHGVHDFSSVRDRHRLPLVGDVNDSKADADGVALCSAADERRLLDEIPEVRTVDVRTAVIPNASTFAY